MDQHPGSLPQKSPAPTAQAPMKEKKPAETARRQAVSSLRPRDREAWHKVLIRRTLTQFQPGKRRNQAGRAGCAVDRTACQNSGHVARWQGRAPDQCAVLNLYRRGHSRNSSSLCFACFGPGICPAISRL